jgi:spore maturation protein CgeB
MACAAPLVSAPWEDRERLFARGRDHLIARDGDEMKRVLAGLLAAPARAAALGRAGFETVTSRHTCAHRAGELLRIVEGLPRPAPRVIRAARPAPAVNRLSEEP